MAADPPDLLVIADLDYGAEVARLLAAEFTVSHSLPPAIFVVTGGSADRRRLLEITGVRAVLAPGDDSGIAEVLDLSPGESLFVQAWLANAAAEPKIRPGDGQNWDAPGRLPPDPPVARDEWRDD